MTLEKNGSNRKAGGCPIFLFVQPRLVFSDSDSFSHYARSIYELSWWSAGRLRPPVRDNICTPKSDVVLAWPDTAMPTWLRVDCEREFSYQDPIGFPRGRSIESSLNCFAIRRPQPSSPKGRLRCALTWSKSGSEAGCLRKESRSCNRTS